MAACLVLGLSAHVPDLRWLEADGPRWRAGKGIGPGLAANRPPLETITVSRSHEFEPPGSRRAVGSKLLEPRARRSPASMPARRVARHRGRNICQSRHRRTDRNRLPFQVGRASSTHRLAAEHLRQSLPPTHRPFCLKQGFSGQAREARGGPGVNGAKARIDRPTAFRRDLVVSRQLRVGVANGNRRRRCKVSPMHPSNRATGSWPERGAMGIHNSFQ